MFIQHNQIRPQFNTINKDKSMALFKCPECGNMVSTNASNCPKCGLPNEPGADKAQLNNDTNNNSSNSANVELNRCAAT
jgi:rubrerythrin